MNGSASIPGKVVKVVHRPNASQETSKKENIMQSIPAKWLWFPIARRKNMSIKTYYKKECVNPESCDDANHSLKKKNQEKEYERNDEPCVTRSLLTGS